MARSIARFILFVMSFVFFVSLCVFVFCYVIGFPIPAFYIFSSFALFIIDAWLGFSV